MQFKTSANVGVGCGIIAMVIGSTTVARGPESFLFGVAAWLVGWALMIWGCVNYARWKGYSGWFGLIGYLLLPGLIFLVCFPNRRKQMTPGRDSELSTTPDALADQDRKSGYAYLLTLLPLALLTVAIGGFVSSTRSDIAPGEWNVVAPPSAGFEALMPGTPEIEKNTQETPAGKVELQKFAAKPRGKKELFMIVAIRFPDEMSAQLGGAEKLLELGRQDVLAACQGQMQSEKRIDLGGVPGLELEVLPARGAIVRSRVFATQSRLYQVSVHVPKIRLASADVQKFLDAFHVSPESGAASDGMGE